MKGLLIILTLLPSFCFADFNLHIQLYESGTDEPIPGAAWKIGWNQGTTDAHGAAYRQGINSEYLSEILFFEHPEYNIPCKPLSEHNVELHMDYINVYVYADKTRGDLFQMQLAIAKSKKTKFDTVTLSVECPERKTKEFNLYADDGKEVDSRKSKLKGSPFHYIRTAYNNLKDGYFTQNDDTIPVIQFEAERWFDERGWPQKRLVGDKIPLAALRAYFEMIERKDMLMRELEAEHSDILAMLELEIDSLLDVINPPDDEIPIPIEEEEPAPPEELMIFENSVKYAGPTIGRDEFVRNIQKTLLRYEGKVKYGGNLTVQFKVLEGGALEVIPLHKIPEHHDLFTAIIGYTRSLTWVPGSVNGKKLDSGFVVSIDITTS